MLYISELQGSYFTFQRDKYLNGSFESCTTKKLVPSNVWAAGEPDNFKQSEICAALKIGPISGLSDINCESKGKNVPVICETQKEISVNIYLFIHDLTVIYKKHV
jgi:hypothetical protein